MALNLTTVGTTTREYAFEYDWKVLALYALGIGARRAELDYLFEARGPKVYPTFAVVPSYDPVAELMQLSGIDVTKMVHGGQSIEILRPIPPRGTCVTRGTVVGMFDMKRFAQVVFRTETEIGGEPCFTTTWTLLGLSDGGFGGRPPPRTARVSFPKDSPPLWTHAEPTNEEQALLYRLSGDTNPLHADPEFARAAGFDRGPILHGLCTFGILGRAIVINACRNEAAELGKLDVQFRSPVWPGEDVRVEAYALDEGREGVKVFAADRAEPVVTGAWTRAAQL